MRVIYQTAIAVALAGGTAAAIANPLNELWFDQNSGFAFPLVEFNTQGGNLINNGPSGPVADPAGTWSSFSWSGNSNPGVSSSILLEDFSTAAGDTGFQLDENFNPDGDGAWNPGDWWQISQLTQTNNVLRISGTTFPDPMWVADALSNLRIFDDAALTSQRLLDSTSDRISFTETLNTTGDCPTGTNPLNTKCDDIFGVALADFDPVFFDIGDYTYKLNFTLLPGPSTPGPVSSTVCSLQNIGTPPCDSLSQGLTDRILGNTDSGIPELLVFTPENSPGTSQVQIYMSYEVVPAPATLALFGLGMLALGYRARKAA